MWSIYTHMQRESGEREPQEPEEKTGSSGCRTLQHRGNSVTVDFFG